MTFDQFPYYLFAADDSNTITIKSLYPLQQNHSNHLLALGHGNSFTCFICC